jgi:hypothetical protein
VHSYGSQTTMQSAPVPPVQFVDNQDPVLATISLTTTDIQDISAFLTDALVDLRVPSGVYPFDAPTLASQRPLPTATVVGDGQQIPAGDPAPQIVVHTPPFAGSDDFTVSVTGAPPGATVQLLSWQDPTPDGRMTVTYPVVVASDAGMTYASAQIPLTAVLPDTHVQFGWRIANASTGYTMAVTPAESIVVFAQRPKLLAAGEVPAAPAPAVDDTDAYGESATFGINYDFAGDLPGGDTFTCIARLGVPAKGVKLSDGRLTLSVGGRTLIGNVPMDARGRAVSSNATASFNAATGRLKVAVREIDLRSAIITSSSVPVRIDVEGLGLEAPVVKTALSFTTTRTADLLAGVYSFVGSGTGNGVFHVTDAKARHVAGSRQRLHIDAAIDTPGALSLAPGALAIDVGGPTGLHLDSRNVGLMRRGVAYYALGEGDLHKIKIDPTQHTFSLDVTTDIPELDAAAPGARVQIPVTLTMQPFASGPAVTFTTTATVTMARR